MKISNNGIEKPKDFLSKSLANVGRFFEIVKFFSSFALTTLLVIFAIVTTKDIIYWYISFLPLICVIFNKIINKKITKNKIEFLIISLIQYLFYVGILGEEICLSIYYILYKCNIINKNIINLYYALFFGFILGTLIWFFKRIISKKQKFNISTTKLILDFFVLLATIAGGLLDLLNNYEKFCLLLALAIYLILIFSLQIKEYLNKSSAVYNVTLAEDDGVEKTFEVTLDK